MKARKKRTVVLISGRGSNMVALAGAAQNPDYPCEIAGVVSNRTASEGLEKARSMGLVAKTVPDGDYPDRESHESAMLEIISGFEAEIVCLAGYMRLLTDGFVGKWKGRILNIHPSLLPMFRGVDTHARALAAGLRIHGCTVHFVTPQMDEGPIIAQAAVPVLTDDDEESLSNRVLAAEHRLYPMALKLVAQGKVRMSGARCVWVDGEEDNQTGELFSPDLPPT